MIVNKSKHGVGTSTGGRESANRCVGWRHMRGRSHVFRYVSIEANGVCGVVWAEGMRERRTAAAHRHHTGTRAQARVLKKGSAPRREKKRKGHRTLAATRRPIPLAVKRRRRRKRPNRLHTRRCRGVPPSAWPVRAPPTLVVHSAG